MIYAQSFFNFMEKVKPKYAVPFASNHCYLHRDVYHLNDIIETPARVQDYLKMAGGFSATELRVMVSGDSWDSQTGFDIRNENWFTDREVRIQNYLEQKRAKLEATYAAEDNTRLRLTEVERYFQRFFKVVPALLKGSFKSKPIILCARHGAGADYFKVDLHQNKVSQIAESDLTPVSIQFETTALILRKAMALNMFSHIGISKRVAYKSRQEDAKHIRKFNELLAAYEYEALPLRRLFSLRTLRVYMRRWREIILYAQLLAGVMTGKSVHQLEAEHLA
jgi:UDP-MurNAc hydroxylase